MSNNKFLPLVLSSFIVSFVCYQYFSKKDEIIENWWNNSGVLMTTNIEKIGPDGNAVPGNNQSNLTYDTNPLINSAFTNPSDIKDSCKPLLKENKENYCSDCTTDGKPNAGFYTVPGQYEAYLPPRMNSAGLNSYVRYQLPPEEYQANKPNDPFTIANYFEKPQMKEDYKAPTSTTPTPVGGQKDLSSKDVKGLELPTPSDMTNTGAVSKDAKDGFFVNSERLIFSLQKNRLQGLGDPIRGDLPIIPCNPNSNPNSNVWFRPAAQPQSMLNGGAMNVLGGTGNTTAQQLSQLMSNAGGGFNNTYGATPFSPASDSVVGQAIEAAANQNINMSAQKTNLTQGGKGIPIGTTYTAVTP